LYLDPRTPCANHAGRATPGRLVNVETHVKALEFLLLDGPRALQTVLGVALIVEALLFALADTASSSQARFFQLCAAVACARYAVEFARRAGAIDLSVQRDGLARTKAKLAALARSAAGKYTFYALFVLLFRRLFFAAAGAPGATAAPALAPQGNLQLARLCLLPLVSREVVHLGWCVRDGLQWIEASAAAPGDARDGDNVAGGHWAASFLRAAGGAAAAAVCGRAPGQFRALGDAGQAALLSKRALQLNTALEAALFLALAARRGAFPTPAHKALCLFVLLRILLADAWARPVAFLRELAPFVATTSSSSRGEEFDLAAFVATTASSKGKEGGNRSAINCDSEGEEGSESESFEDSAPKSDSE
jgi:hypothetical protein